MARNRSRIRRRRLLVGLGAGVAAFAGCTEQGEDGGDGGDGGGGNDSDGGDGGDGGSGQLSVTGVWSGGEQEDFTAVTEYVQEETGHGIEYQSRTTDSLLTETLLDYESEVATADIVVMPSPARIRSDASNGHLEPIGDTWNPENYAVDPERVSVDGDVYAAPFKFDLKPGFWYRQSFFEEHGLSEPGDYDEFLSLLDEIAGIDGVEAPLASGNGDGWPLSDQTEAFVLRQTDGPQRQQDLIAGDASFTDDRVRSAFEELQSLLQEGYFSQQRQFAVQYEFMWDGTHPLYFMGSWTPAMDAIKDASDLGVFRLPGTEGMVASVNWFTVPAYSENVDAAKEAVEQFVSTEGQQVWAERGGFIASNTEVPSDAYEVEIMAQLPEMADEVTVVPDLDDAVGNPFQEEFWSQLKGLWSTPDTELDSLLSTLDETLQETLQEDGNGG
jgi:multiple sugar transport system substrate-binding protein